MSHLISSYSESNSYCVICEALSYNFEYYNFESLSAITKMLRRQVLLNKPVSVVVLLKQIVLDIQCACLPALVRAREYLLEHAEYVLLFIYDSCFLE